MHAVVSAPTPSRSVFSGRPPAGARHQHGGSQPRAAIRARSAWHQFTDPHTVLGLQRGATEDEVKSAYRRLAKQYHPDVSKSNTELQFLTIAEAYAQLTRGRDGQASCDGSPRPHTGNSQAFHDWYWSFRLRRTWGAQRRSEGEATMADSGHAQSPPPPPPPASPVQSAEAVRSQLAGLRHRAAIRKQRPQPDATAASVPHEDAVRADLDIIAAHAHAFVADGPSDSGDPQPTQVHAQGVAEGGVPKGGSAQRRPSFVATNDSREDVKEQLAGLRRKTVLRAQVLP